MRDPFARQDPSDDSRFYAIDRKVTHIEVGAIEALRSAYGALIPDGAAVLDLMSSWRSHLPHDGLGPITGLGMNAAEMADNPQLDDYLVHDLNRDPRLPFNDHSFDACVCTVSVQYLVHPTVVFTDVRRVMRPGAPIAVSFSNRCFPTKAVAVWLSTTDAEHRILVRSYLEDAGFASVHDEQLASQDDPVYLITGKNPA